MGDSFCHAVEAQQGFPSGSAVSNLLAVRELKEMWV